MAAVQISHESVSNWIHLSAAESHHQMETKFLPHLSILLLALIMAWYFDSFDFGPIKYTSKNSGNAVDELLKKKHHVIGNECIPETNTCFLIIDSYYLENNRLTTKRDLVLSENTEYSLTGVEVQSVKPVSWENIDSRHWPVNKLVINSRYARLLVASGFVMEVQRDERPPPPPPPPLLPSLNFDDNDHHDVLIAGLGGGVMSNFFSEIGYLNIETTVVEKEEFIIELAERYFDHFETDQLRVVHSDVVNYLEQSDKKYDVIIMDACENRIADVMCPVSDILKEEAIQLLKKRMTLKGTLAVNVYATKNSDKTEEAILNAFSKVFKSCFYLEYFKHKKDQYRRPIRQLLDLFYGEGHLEGYLRASTVALRLYVLHRRGMLNPNNNNNNNNQQPIQNVHRPHQIQPPGGAVRVMQGHLIQGNQMQQGQPVQIRIQGDPINLGHAQMGNVQQGGQMQHQQHQGNMQGQRQGVHPNQMNRPVQQQQQQQQGMNRNQPNQQQMMHGQNQQQMRGNMQQQQMRGQMQQQNQMRMQGQPQQFQLIAPGPGPVPQKPSPQLQKVQPRQDMQQNQPQQLQRIAPGPSQMSQNSQPMLQRGQQRPDMHSNQSHQTQRMAQGPGMQQNQQQQLQRIAPGQGMQQNQPQQLQRIAPGPGMQQNQQQQHPQMRNQGQGAPVRERMLPPQLTQQNHHMNEPVQKQTQQGQGNGSQQHSQGQQMNNGPPSQQQTNHGQQMMNRPPSHPQAQSQQGPQGMNRPPSHPPQQIQQGQSNMNTASSSQNMNRIQTPEMHSSGQPIIIGNAPQQQPHIRKQNPSTGADQQQSRIEHQIIQNQLAQGLQSQAPKGPAPLVCVPMQHSPNAPIKMTPVGQGHVIQAQIMQPIRSSAQVQQSRPMSQPPAESLQQQRMTQGQQQAPMHRLVQQHRQETPPAANEQHSRQPQQGNIEGEQIHINRNNPNIAIIDGVQFRAVTVTSHRTVEPSNSGRGTSQQQPQQKPPLQNRSQSSHLLLPPDSQVLHQLSQPNSFQRLQNQLRAADQNRTVGEHLQSQLEKQRLEQQRREQEKRAKNGEPPIGQTRPSKPPRVRNRSKKTASVQQQLHQQMQQAQQAQQAQHQNNANAGTSEPNTSIAPSSGAVAQTLLNRNKIVPPIITPVPTDFQEPNFAPNPPVRMVQQGKHLVQVGGTPDSMLQSRSQTPGSSTSRSQAPSRQTIPQNQKPIISVPQNQDQKQPTAGAVSSSTSQPPRRQKPPTGPIEMTSIQEAIVAHVTKKRKLTPEYHKYIVAQLTRVANELEKSNLKSDPRYMSVMKLLHMVKDVPLEIEAPERPPRPVRQQPDDLPVLPPHTQTAEEREERYESDMEILKNAYPLIPNYAKFGGIDDETIRQEALYYMKYDMMNRAAFLRENLDRIPEELQIKAKIEYLGLEMKDLQEKVRREVMATLVYEPPTEFLLNPWSIRRPKADYQQELRANPDRALLEKERRNKNSDMLHHLVRHVREFREFHKKNAAVHTKVRKSMQTYITNEAKRKSREELKNEKIRIQKLIQEDEEGYRAMLDDKKDQRLVYLLEQTDGYIENLTDLLKKQKNSGEELPFRPPVRKEYEGSVDNKSLLAKARNDDDEYENKTKANAGDYYAIAHGIREEVTGQHHTMGGGDPNLKLKPYQLKGLEWMVSLYNNNLNGILADEMGLGKTIQTIAFITYLMEKKKTSGPFLVIVPLSTISNWKSEFDKWAAHVQLIVYKGPKDSRKAIEPIIKSGKFNVLLTTFEYVIREKALLGKLRWKYMIIDEGHRLKNQHCKLTEMLNTRFQCQRRLLITGTPLQNKLPELWALLNFLLPAIFSSCSTFEQWFNAPFSTAGEKVELSQEETMLIIRRLHKVLRPFLLRRLKKEVASDLPDKTEFVLKCEMSALQKVLYKHMQKGLLLDGKTNTGSRSLMNSMVHLRKLCNHPFLFRNVEESCRGFWDVKMVSGTDLYRVSGKLELLDRILPKLKATGHRVLMFFQMTSMMTIVEDYLTHSEMEYLRLDGTTKPDERGQLLDKFNAPNSKYFLFMLSTRAGGLGLNLQTADTVIIFDSDWNPHQDMQAQDRAHRIGQTAEVRVYRLITANSVEEKILASAKFKLNVDEKVIQAGKFDNRSTGEERKQILEQIIQAENEGEEDDDVPNDEEINDMLSRGEEEFELFQKMDQKRNHHDHFHGVKPRLVEDDEIPKDILRAADETDYAEKAREEGRVPYLEVMPGSRRKRKEVDYSADSLSEDKFIEKLLDGEEITPVRTETKDIPVAPPARPPVAQPAREDVPLPVKLAPAPVPTTSNQPANPPLTFKVPRISIKFGSDEKKRLRQNSEGETVITPIKLRKPDTETVTPEVQHPPIQKIRIKLGGETFEKFIKPPDVIPMEKRDSYGEGSSARQAFDEETPKKKKKRHDSGHEETSEKKKKKKKHREAEEDEETPKKKKRRTEGFEEKSPKKKLTEVGELEVSPTKKKTGEVRDEMTAPVLKKQREPDSQETSHKKKHREVDLESPKKKRRESGHEDLSEKKKRKKHKHVQQDDKKVEEAPSPATTTLRVAPIKLSFNMAQIAAASHISSTPEPIPVAEPTPEKPKLCIRFKMPILEPPPEEQPVQELLPKETEETIEKKKKRKSRDNETEEERKARKAAKKERKRLEALQVQETSNEAVAIQPAPLVATEPAPTIQAAPLSTAPSTSSQVVIDLADDDEKPPERVDIDSEPETVLRVDIDSEPEDGDAEPASGATEGDQTRSVAVPASNSAPVPGPEPILDAPIVPQYNAPSEEDDEDFEITSV